MKIKEFMDISNSYQKHYRADAGFDSMAVIQRGHRFLLSEYINKQNGAIWI